MARDIALGREGVVYSTVGFGEPKREIEPGQTVDIGALTLRK